VAAQFSCGFQGVEVASRNGGMNADSNASAHPRWGQRFWLRFRAVFVFWIELGRLRDGLFRHASGKFQLPIKLPILAHAPNHSLCGNFSVVTHAARAPSLDREVAEPHVR